MSGVFMTASLVSVESLLHELLYIMFNLNNLVGCLESGGVRKPGARTYY